MLDEEEDIADDDASGGDGQTRERLVVVSPGINRPRSNMFNERSAERRSPTAGFDGKPKPDLLITVGHSHR